MHFALADAHDQFLLEQGRAPAPAGWQSRAAGGWTLSHHPSLPVVEVTTSDGLLGGWLLGWPISDHGLITSAVTLPAGGWAAVEQVLGSWAGRFALVALHGSGGRVYLDAAGSLAAVYRPATRRVASTVSAVLHDEPDHEVFHRPEGAFPAQRPNQYFPAGLTAVDDVSRLLPNHHLDLGTWQPARHHPTAMPARARRAAEVDDLVDEIVELLTSTITTALSVTPRGYLGLTGGRDTRTLLACARGVLDRVELVTFDYRRVGADPFDRSDVFAATRLLSDIDRPKHMLVVQEEPREVLDRYMWRTGFAGNPGKARDFDVACRRALEMDAAWMPGFLGELGRAVLWKEHDELTDTPSPEELIRRLRLGSHYEFAVPMQEWLDRLPVDDDLMAVLDLGMLEHRSGAWASAHLYGAAPFRMNFMPFASRRLFDVMGRLPVEFRRQDRLADEVLRRTWPELAAFPYGGFTGVRRVVEGVRRRGGALRKQLRRPGLLPTGRRPGDDRRRRQTGARTGRQR